MFSIFLFFLSFFHFSHSLDQNFRNWMKNHLSSDDYEQLVRDDVKLGCFGGGIYNGSTKPIILVHGMNAEAGTLLPIRSAFVSDGYPIQRIFATTWGYGADAEQLNTSTGISCSYVKALRLFIRTVLDYTGSDQIILIGYSMGSPICRKAILGGRCVDDLRTDLGEPLTNQIHNYISVGGVNQGFLLCENQNIPVCNPINGLSCESDFLSNINSMQYYEASYRSYNLASADDQLVGYYACAKKASSFTGSLEWKVFGFNHNETIFETTSIQFAMIFGSDVPNQ